LTQEGQGLWYEGLLAELLKERRKIPKADRVKKFRNDSVDEIDTSDMEAYLTGQLRKDIPLPRSKQHISLLQRFLKAIWILVCYATLR
jgi:hypothetical protein